MKNLGSYRLNNHWVAILLLLGVSCKTERRSTPNFTNGIGLTIIDPHSYANFKEIQTKHLSLELDINFKNKTIYGVARHTVINRKARKAIFDIHGPLIRKVTTGPKNQEKEVDFIIGKMDKDSILGQPLIVSISPETKYINIYYQTTQQCAAIEWINTKSKENPWMYTQGQAILARSWIPIQDAPSNRFTYDATVKVQPGLLALMSASNPKTSNKSGKYYFKMDKPIPSYLIALTAGNIVYHPYSDQCGIYAHPEIIDKAKEEFSALPKMIASIEQIFGPYAWGNYDVLVQHPSFPFGGMENPKLTFVSPSIVAGDKSLVSVIAHELAHSWSGNLVTNETWNDFWLNEGFTVYLEHRIMEALYGKAQSLLLSEIEMSELVEEMKTIKSSKHPEDAALCLNLKNRNPDDGMTSIAYVKGAYFLKTLEHKVGQKKMDAFLKDYFKAFQYTSISTKNFVKYLNEKLLLPNYVDFNLNEWIYQYDLPSNCFTEPSSLLQQVNYLANATNSGIDVFAPKQKFKWVEKKKRRRIIRKKVWYTEQLNPKIYNTQQWIIYLRQLNPTLTKRALDRIERYNHFSEANSELQFEWFMLNLKCNNWSIAPKIEKFLSATGRRKFVEPLFTLVLRDSNRLGWAKRVFDATKNNYHSVTQQAIHALFQKYH